MTKSSDSTSNSKETSKDKAAPATKEAESQVSAPEDGPELGDSRLLGGPTSDDLNPAFAPPKDEGKDEK